MTQSASLLALKRLLIPLLFLSLISNLAILVSPIFMMQVLDRVVPSGNLSTLALLLLVALAALFIQGFVDYSSDIALDNTSRFVETFGTSQVFSSQQDASQDALNDITALIQFFSSGLAKTALNIPWIPVFVIALSLIHPYYVVLVLGIVAVLLAVSQIEKLWLNDPQKTVASLRQDETKILEHAVSFQKKSGIAEVSKNLFSRYFSLCHKRQTIDQSIAKVAKTLTAVSGFIKAATQLLALSLGAFLVVQGALSAGGMIAASIILAKTVGIIDGCSSGLPRIKMAFGAYGRLIGQTNKSEVHQTEIENLTGHLRCEELIYPRGGGAPARLDRISFVLEAGECLGIIGDSGSGKSTLLKALCGVEPCPIGAVFLDDTEVRTLGAKSFYNTVGYLTQQAELLDGTIAENICCFSETPDDAMILKAANTAGVHGLISSLPRSYETDLSYERHLLSAGQCQRIAMARAIYNSPKYLFLDEPNALLDAIGERQLCDTLARLKSQGVTIVMVLHRSGVLGLTDKILRIDHGRVADFGNRTEVLGRMNNGSSKLEIPLSLNSLQDVSDWITERFSRNSDQEFCQKAVLIASEMFNIALQNAPNDRARIGRFHFKFEDEKTCEITLTEDQPTSVTQKMNKIRSLLKHPEVNMLDLDADEMGLAVVAQMSDGFEIKNIENTAVFTALLKGQRKSLSQGIQH
ncbi:MAG: hypothetical protein COB84_10210 [Rhodobacteraceae bacterium]|nr:MAG: hypothetical protein COB84_10210 [Paracoccaceae bacterium]